MNDKITNAGAVAASCSHYWLPTLHQVSDVAADLLPIFGVAWLLTQFYFKVRHGISKE